MGREYSLHNPQWDSEALCDLPLFRDIINETTSSGPDLSNRLNHAGSIHNRISKSKNNNDNQSSISNSVRYSYPIPLSAYSIHEELPNNFSKKLLVNSEKFDELGLKYDSYRSSKRSIKHLGYNSIRPIGINKTMKELHDLKKQKEADLLESANREDSNNIQMIQPLSLGNQLPNQFQENEDITNVTEMIPTSVSNIFQDRIQVQPGREELYANNDQEDEGDDDISYDYDAEFDQVIEDEEEGGEVVNADPNVQNDHTIIHNNGVIENIEEESINQIQVDNNIVGSEFNNFSNTFRSGTRLSGGQSIQEYVAMNNFEQSSFDDIGDGSDNDLIDEHEFTQIPSLNMSETIQENDVNGINSDDTENRHRHNERILVNNYSDTMSDYPLNNERL